MKRIILTALTAHLSYFSFSQNLVVNPGAEDIPLGTGWTIVKAGANACSGSPTNTYNAWTMSPDGSANYPGARTGSRQFFAGCNTAVPESGFELMQSIDLSAYAGPIDLLGLSTVFTGFIQTPVSPQLDAGRFVVDFLDVNDVVLGTGYSSPWQSFAGGSGNPWTMYTDTRFAPVGARTVVIRLQASITTGPAINAYFDDISFVVTNTLPVRLQRFSGEQDASANALTWTTGEEINVAFFDVERAGNGSDWKSIGRLDAAGNSTTDVKYTFRDEDPEPLSYYRLRMVDLDGRFAYSHQVVLRSNPPASLTVQLFPNPARDHINLRSDYAERLSVRVLSISGQAMMELSLTPRNNQQISIDKLPAGTYVVQVRNTKGQSQTIKLQKL